MSSLDMDALAVHLLRGTQEAALACRPWVGRGDSDKADAAAVAAMREAFDTLPGRGTVVIGEGEKDEAPMLYIGESVGDGDGPAFDLAVDPLENTSACARAAEGAIAVVAAAPEGGLWGSPASWYMDKVVVGPAAVGAVEIDRPVEENLDSVAKALGKPVSELTTVVLDKPRHEDLIERIYAAGASIVLIPEGDVFGALRVMLPDTRADALFGVGGAPEGVITAAFVRLLGGDMQASLAPQSDEEREKLADAGQEPGRPLQLDDLVSNAECCFVATSVTAGQILRGPTRTEAGWRTQSFVSTPTQRRLVVEAVHLGRDLSETPQGD
ncbi:MAG TPA: class II fructose-bisphosphatase [Egibacteraceae bacterium]|nr:class II fructose-bisphosphatase [Actinomycetota bacterium]HWB73004.1 class II fructose-bisphosphatase [Egibacteraceae bacterium]